MALETARDAKTLHKELPFSSHRCFIISFRGIAPSNLFQNDTAATRYVQIRVYMCKSKYNIYIYTFGGSACGYMILINFIPSFNIAQGFADYKSNTSDLVKTYAKNITYESPQDMSMAKTNFNSDFGLGPKESTHVNIDENMHIYKHKPTTMGTHNLHF